MSLIVPVASVEEVVVVSSLPAVSLPIRLVLVEVGPGGSERSVNVMNVTHGSSVVSSVALVTVYVVPPTVEVLEEVLENVLREVFDNELVVDVVVVVDVGDVGCGGRSWIVGQVFSGGR